MPITFDNSNITRLGFKIWHHTGILPLAAKLTAEYNDQNFALSVPPLRGRHKYRAAIIKYLHLITLSSNVHENFYYKLPDAEGFLSNLIKESTVQAIKDGAKETIATIGGLPSQIYEFVSSLLRRISQWYQSLGLIPRVAIIVAVAILFLALLKSSLYIWAPDVYQFLYGEQLSVSADVAQAQADDTMKLIIRKSMNEWFGSFNEVQSQTKKFSDFTLSLKHLKEFVLSIGEFITLNVDDFHRWLYEEAFTARGKAMDSLKEHHERITKLISTKHTNEIYRSKSMMEEVVNAYDCLVENYSTFQPSGHEAIKFHQSIGKQISTWKQIYDVCCHNLTMIKNSEVRIEPICLMLVGSSGTGKTFLVPILQQTASMVMRGEKFKPSDTWSRNSKDDFYSGYHGQWCVVLDEFLQNKDPSLQGEQAEELIGWVNTQPLNLNSAALNDKGVTFFNSQFIIGTTNATARPNVPIMSLEALWRRYIAVEIVENSKCISSNYTYADLDKCYVFKMTYHDINDVKKIIVEHGNYSRLMQIIAQRYENNKSKAKISGFDITSQPGEPLIFEASEVSSSNVRTTSNIDQIELKESQVFQN